MTEINPELKGAVEAVIFVSEKSINSTEIQNVLEGLDLETINAIVRQLQTEYEERNSGIKLLEVAGGWQFVTSPHYASFVKKFYKIKHAEKLSMPSLETLSVIAYKQPVTKMEIELIRGVNVDGITKNLLEKGLIRIVGRKQVIGRPFVYGTTRNFLEYFGLNSLNELPDIETFVESIKARELLQKEDAPITPIEEEELEAVQEETKQITQEDPHQTVETNNQAEPMNEQEKESATPNAKETSDAT